MRRALSAGCELVWLLNNDAFPAEGCLERLVAALRRDATLAGVTPELYRPDGTTQHVGGRADWGTGDLSFLDSGELPRPLPRDHYVTGTALLLRAAALRGVGLFDPRFFAYWEETDLCARLLGRGWDLAAVPEAACRHLEGATAGGAEGVFPAYMLTRNAWLFVRKRTPARRMPQALLRVLAASLLRAGDHARWQRPVPAAGVLAGAWAVLVHGSGPPGRLRLPARAERFLLKYHWSLARRLWAAADRLGPAGRRPFPG